MESPGVVRTAPLMKSESHLVSNRGACLRTSGELKSSHSSWFSAQKHKRHEQCQGQGRRAEELLERRTERGRVNVPWLLPQRRGLAADDASMTFVIKYPESTRIYTQSDVL